MGVFQIDQHGAAAYLPAPNTLTAEQKIDILYDQWHEIFQICIDEILPKVKEIMDNPQQYLMQAQASMFGL